MNFNPKIQKAFILLLENQLEQLPQRFDSEDFEEWCFDQDLIDEEQFYEDGEDYDPVAGQKAYRKFIKNIESGKASEEDILTAIDWITYI